MGESASPFADFQTLADPYETYRILRERSPVYWDDPEDWWLLTRYDDVVSALRDERFSAEVGTPSVDQLPPGERLKFDRLQKILSALPLFSEPPAHTAIRAELQRAFTPRSVAQLAGTLRRFAESLTEQTAAAERVDVLHDIAVPMADLAFTAITGVEPAALPRLRAINDGLIGALGGHACAERAQRAQDSVHELTEMLREQTADGPGGGVMAALAGAVLEHRLTEDQAVAALAQLVTGGLEPTPQTLAAAVLLLVRNPEQRARLLAAPELVPGAVEEALRLEPPFLLVHRVARADVRYGQQVVVRGGDHVALLLGAANRDPERFPDPDRFLPDREPNRHLSFGLGHHFCLGSGLVRLVARVTLEALLPVVDAMRPTSDELEYLPLIGIRKLKAGPVLVPR